MNAALNIYFGFPNHEAKAFGVQNTNPLPGSLDLLQCENGVDTIIEDYKKVPGWNNEEIQKVLSKIESDLQEYEVAIAYEVKDGYFFIQTSDDGFDYTLYTKDFVVVDGGVLESDDERGVYAVVEDIISDFGYDMTDCKVIDSEWLREEADRVGQEQIEAIQDQMKPKPTIKFYVAECAECPPCGIFHTCATLEEALALYDDLSEGRINDTRGLGFEIEHDSTVDGMVDILLDDKIQQDMFAKVDPQGKNPLVQKTKTDLEKLMSARAEKQKAAQVQPEQKPKTKKRNDMEL